MLKGIFWIGIFLGAAYLIYYWHSTTDVCKPYRTVDGYLDATCIRYENSEAQTVLRTERGSFISNPDSWKQIRDYNIRLDKQRERGK